MRTTEKEVRKQVIHSLPGFWKYAFFSMVLFLGIQLFSLLPSILMQRVIDDFIPNKQTDKMLFYIFLFCLIPLIVTAISAFYRYMLAIICRKMGQHLAIHAFGNIVCQPVSYFDGKNSSELATHCRTESMQYIIFWMIDIPQLVATGICGIVILGYLFMQHWSVALILILYFPFAYLPSNAFANKVQKMTKQIISNNARMNQIINDTFRGIKIVKAMNLEGQQVKKLDEVNEKNVEIWGKVALLDNLSGIWINDFSDAIFTGLTFGISAFLVIYNRLTLGSIVVVLNYTSKFLSVAKKIMNTNYNFKEKLGEYDKLFEILTMETPADTQKPFEFKDEIRFSDVTFAYDGHRGNVLKSLNLSVYCNEWLGIVGHSGAGKTTIFDLLMGFYKPQKGKITVDGVDLQEISISSRCAKIAKIAQDTYLFPGTIRENLLLANPKATDEQLDVILDKVCLTDFLSRLPDGLDTEIGENGLLLSGGERQKLGLAQGLLRNCKIILLDEVTSNVDRDSEEEIKNILLRLKKENDLTLISISHRIDFLKDTDRIVVLEKGCIKETSNYHDYTGS